MARTAANVKKRRYKFMYRTAAAFGSGNWDTIANHDTFLATFTDGGICRAGLGFTVENGDIEEIDDGSEIVMGKNAVFEAEFLQSDVTDYTALEAIEGIAQDILLVPTDDLLNEIVIGEALLYIGEEVKSGDTEVIKLTYNKTNVASSSVFRTRFGIPQS